MLFIVALINCENIKNKVNPSKACVALLGYFNAILPLERATLELVLYLRITGKTPWL